MDTESSTSGTVWNQTATIGLGLARSFGDSEMRRVGVIAQPEVRSRRLDPADQFMIVASDGVWEYITDDEAVELIAQFPNDATLGVSFCVCFTVSLMLCLPCRESKAGATCS